MAEERFESIWRFVTPAAGGPWSLHISLWPVVERRRGEQTVGRNSLSLKFRSLRVVKRGEYRVRADATIRLFLLAQLDRVRFYAVEYAMRHPRFISGLSTSSRVWYRVKYCISCRRCRKSIRDTNVWRRNVRQFFARIAPQARISYTWFVTPPKRSTVTDRWTAWLKMSVHFKIWL